MTVFETFALMLGVAIPFGFVLYVVWLFVRFLQLGCKVFKKYLREDDTNPFVLSYGDEDDD